MGMFDEITAKKENTSKTSLYDEIVNNNVNNEKPWYKQFGKKAEKNNTAKSIIATPLDIYTHFIRSGQNLFESYLDVPVYGASTIANKLGYKNTAEELRKFADKSLVDEYDLPVKTATGSMSIGPLTPLALPGYIAKVKDNLSDGYQKGDIIKTFNPFADSSYTKGARELINDYSVAGNTTNELAEGAGYFAAQYGLQSVKIPWQVSAGISSANSELKNAYANGATDEQAWASALISAGIEIGTEYLSGGVKLPGTGKTTERIISKITSKIGNNALKYLTEMGVNLAGEGIEEVLSGYGTAIGQKLTYMSDKELNELYSNDDALKDFALGVGVTALTQGANPGTYKNIKTGRSLINNLTKEEQNELDKRVSSEQEKLGRNLTNKEYEAIEEDILKNGITQNIESEENITENLEKFNQKQQKLKQQQLQQETNKKVKNIQQELAELKENIPTANTEGMDLQQSAARYNINPTSEAITSMQSLYDKRGINARYDGTLPQFKDGSIAGLWSIDNNGNRSVILNPYASEDTIIQNLAIHELTHDLMSSANSNQALKANEIIDYVKTLDGYAEARKALEDTYRSEYGKNTNFNDLIDEEVVADVLGRKLGNQEFINQLVNGKPSIAKKIYNWVVDKLNSLVNRGGNVRSEKLYWQNIKNRFEKAFNMEYNNSTNEASTMYSKSKDDPLFIQMINKVGSDYVGKLVVNDANNYYIIDKDANNNYEKVLTIPITDKNSKKIKELSKEYENVEGRKEISSDIEGTRSGQRNDNNDNSSNGREETLLEHAYRVADETRQEPNNNSTNTRQNNVNKGELNSSFSNETRLSKESDEWNNFLDKNLKDAGTTGTLMAIHNISEDKLKEILKLGGFPAPSIAITDISKTSHDKYGNISILFNKNTIDPSNIKNEVYSSDIYSARFPNLTYKIDNTKWNNFTKWVKDNDGSVSGLYAARNNIENNYIDERNMKANLEVAFSNPTEELINEAYKRILDTIGSKRIEKSGIEPFRADGSRKPLSQITMEYTLDNLVKEMTKNRTRGSEGNAWTGTGEIRANLSKRFSSIEDIRNNKKDIVSEEDMQKYRDEIDNKFSNLTSQLSKYYKYKDTYIGYALDNVSDSINETAKAKNINKNTLKQKLADNFIENVPDNVLDETIEFLNDLRNAPTEYFEAKPQRAVGLDEVEAIVIPNTASEEFRKALNDVGLDYVEYDSKVKGDRQRVINKFDNLKFSKESPEWKKFVNKHFKPEGTTTKLGDIKLPSKKQVNLPTKQEVKTTPKQELNLPKNPTKESSYEVEPKKKTQKVARQELLEDMDVKIEDIAKGKDISSINYQVTDPIRVNEKVFGAEIGQKINDATINQTKHNEAERNRFLNKERQEIKDLGIKPRSKESAAVQKYGEKQYLNDNGELVKYGDKELAAEFPNVETQKKIKHAAEVLRNKYDRYIEDINNVITDLGYDPIPKRPDYMRHFQEINDKLSEWGIPLNPTSMNENNIPTDINGLTDQFKPGKNWFASAMQRKGMKTTYDAITGIDGYLEGASNLIYHTGDIQRYRALSKLIRDTYGQTHGMDNIDPSTEAGQQRLQDIFDNKLSKYAAWIDEQANSLAGKKSKIDRGAEEVLGRKIYSVLEAAKKQVGSNMTGFNVRSALTNFASAVQGASKTQKVAFLKGTISTMQNIIHDDGLINKSDFLTSRLKNSDQLSKKFWQKASNAGQIFMTGTDYFTANQIWRSKYYENLSKGMNENQAIKNADDFAARIMGDRSKGSTAAIFNSKTLGLLTQFQLEVNNQWQSIIHDNKMDLKTGNKSGATVMFQLGQLFAMSYFFNSFMKSLTGSDVMIDPIDMLKKIIGAGDDDDDKTIEQRAREVFGDLINDLPFVSFLTGGRIPISEAFKGLETLGKYATGQKDQYGNEIKPEDIKNDLIESGFYWLLPTGYGQLKKTYQGLSMYDTKLPTPGSYTKSGNLRFEADTSAKGKIQSALFGQYASKNAREYFDKGYVPLKPSQIEEAEKYNMSIPTYRDFANDLKEAQRTKVETNNGTYEMYTDNNDNWYWYNIENGKVYETNMSIFDEKSLKETSLSPLSLQKVNKSTNTYGYIMNLNVPIDEKVKMLNSELGKKETITDKYGFEKYKDNNGNVYWYDTINKIVYDNKYTKSDKNLSSLIKATNEYTKEAVENTNSLEELNYYVNNPEKYALIRQITTYKKYKQYDEKIDSIKERYTTTSERKNAVAKYVNTLSLSVPQKAMLIKSNYKSFTQYDKQIIEYVNKQSISKKEKEQILTDLGFTVKNGRVY